MGDAVQPRANRGREPGLHYLRDGSQIRRPGSETEGFELLAAPATSIVVFRHVAGSVPPATVDELNARLPVAVQLRGESFLTGTTLAGRPVLRACFLNPRTTEADLRLLLDELIAAKDACR
jgi:aromatic-L-amino-acid decarboxylase